MKVEISKSHNPDKIYKLVLHYDDGRQKTLHIGQAEDFTKTGDEKQKEREKYIENKFNVNIN